MVCLDILVVNVFLSGIFTEKNGSGVNLELSLSMNELMIEVAVGATLVYLFASPMGPVEPRVPGLFSVYSSIN